MSILRPAVEMVVLAAIGALAWPVLYAMRYCTTHQYEPHDAPDLGVP